jgi:hypothetical protein
MTMAGKNTSTAGYKGNGLHSDRSPRRAAARGIAHSLEENDSR